MKIQFRLLLAFAVIILIMLVGNFFAISFSKRSLGDSIGQSHVVQARQIMENIDREIYYRIEEIRGYGRDVLLREALERSNREMAELADREALIRQREQEWLAAPRGTVTPFMVSLTESPLAEELREKKAFYTQEWLKHPVYPEMVVTNRYGVVVATTGGTSNYLLADREWYRQATGEKEFWLGNLRYDKEARVFFCDIVVKLFAEDREFAGFFKAVLNLETILSILRRDAEQHAGQSGQEQYVFVKLLTRDDRLIFTCEPGYETNQDLSGQDFLRRIGRESEGGYFVSAGDRKGEGTELFAYARSVGYRDYPGQGWLVIFEQDFEEVFAPVSSFVRHMWAIAVVMVLVAILFTHYFSRSFAGLVAKLGVTTEQLRRKILEQEQTEESLQRGSKELDARVKELNCLYGILKLVEKENDHVGTILQGAVDLIRSSWRDPALVCARIRLEDQTWRTADFRETPWRLSREIMISGAETGVLEVYWLGEHPGSDEDPFLKEERYLINAIAEQLGNVCERIKATKEKQQMQAFVFQQEKLASVGQLAAGVAHEINNPIGFITSNLGSLKKYIAKLVEYVAAVSADMERSELRQLEKKLRLDFVVKDIRALVDESIEGTERVREIVQNLKSFSRVDEVKFKEADINECLENTIKIIWNELKYKAKVVKALGEVPPIRCYPQQLNQVFMNLLVNAAQAIEKEGVITLRSWREGEHVFVSVSDTGQGIPAENVNKLFEPFFTTKEAGKGTGLGLSIAHEIIKKHHGRIEVASEVGKGSTFTVALPIGGNA
ncbi:sensor histidine kinase [Thiovibrio sp. JS02]